MADDPVNKAFEADRLIEGRGVIGPGEFTADRVAEMERFAGSIVGPQPLVCAYTRWVEPGIRIRVEYPAHLDAHANDVRRIVDRAAEELAIIDRQHRRWQEAREARRGVR